MFYGCYTYTQLACKYFEKKGTLTQSISLKLYTCTTLIGTSLKKAAELELKLLLFRWVKAL
jgi:hypothetical protein